MNLSLAFYSDGKANHGRSLEFSPSPWAVEFTKTRKLPDRNSCGDNADIRYFPNNDKRHYQKGTQKKEANQEFLNPKNQLTDYFRQQGPNCFVQDPADGRPIPPGETWLKPCPLCKYEYPE